MSIELAVNQFGGNEFRKLTSQNFIELMKIPAVIDCRRIYDVKTFSSKLRFIAVGLGEEELML